MIPLRKSKRDPLQKQKAKLSKSIKRQVAKGIPIGNVISSLEQEKSHAMAQATKTSKKLSPSSRKFNQTLQAHNVQMNWILYIDGQIGHLQSLMSKRNEKAQQLERDGQIERAIPLYEANVKDRFNGTLPYDRLRIIYTRQKRYADATRVCQSYLKLSNRPGQNKKRFKEYLKKLRKARSS